MKRYAYRTIINVDKTSQKEYGAQEKDIVLKRKGSVIAYLLGNLNERFLQKNKLEKKRENKEFLTCPWTIEKSLN